MALLLSEGIEPRTHAGLVSLLGLHFIKAGLLDPDDGRLFARIQRYRVEADYSRSFVVTAAGAREDMVACEGFVERVKTLLVSRGYAV